MAAANGVAVHAADARGGKDFSEAFFALLRAGAEIVEVLGVALRAAGRDGAAVSAVVALEALPFTGEAVFGRRLVVREGDGAVLALELGAAGAAHDGEGVTAAVEQNDGLLAAFEGSLRLLYEGARKEIFAAGLLKFLAHVDELDFRHGALRDALAHFNALVFAENGVLPRFKGGGSRAEDDKGVGEFGAHDGDIARVVTRS